jgi:3-deoxy-D-manno-octulosonic-acid transferase
MSVRAHGRYAKLAGVFGQLLAGVKVLAMAGDDAQRFRGIGARDVHVLGNLKLDLVASGDKALSEALLRELGIGDRPVFIAGSVREGEEQPVVDAIIRITNRIPDLYSIIAPRHPDRVQYIADMAAGLGIRWGLRSRSTTGQPGIDLLIVDTMGELFTLYGISDAAFVGGSLLDMGGQNILEPVAWGVPTLHGQSMGNFVWALDAVKGLTTTVKDARGLADSVIAMLVDQKASKARGLEAREALRSSRGVTKRYLHALEPYLGRASSIQ